MAITFDPVKRQKTLDERGLDFSDADKVLAGRAATREDTRYDYGEKRLITAGFLNARFVVMVWTPRGSDTHILSFRYGHDDERRRWGLHVG